jgi:hypothetical protein
MGEAIVLLAVWLSLSSIFVLITTQDVSPLRNRAVLLPVTALFGGAAVAAILWRRWQPWWLAAASTGYLAAWVVLMLRVAVQGSPVGFGGHTGDAGRLAALATKYSVTWQPADAIVPGITGEYPPLLPWLAGRIAALVGLPGWQLVGPMEIAFSSATVIAGFLLWRRLFPAWTAFVLCALTVGVSFGPAKAFSVISLIVFIPLVLATLARPDRGRLHWLPAGLIFGLVILSYWGWFVFGAFGLLACVVMTWRAEQDRLAYLRYLAKIVGTGLVVSAGFVIPLVNGMLTNWGPSTGDTYGQPGQHAGLFPFLEPNIFGMLQLAGVTGLIWLRRSVWWASPLLALTLGAFAFRFLGMTYFFLTNHTLLFYYTERLYTAVLVAGGVLAIAEALPRLASWLDRGKLTELTAFAVAVSTLWAAWNLAHSTLPGTGGPGSIYARAAFAEALPDGSYTINGRRLPEQERTPWYPVSLVEQAVQRLHGPQAQPVTLSYHESFYVYLPWPGYLPVDRGASANGVHWDDRFAELKRLAQTRDPAEFSAASASTSFGPIDVFMLREDESGWQWTAHIAHNMPDETVVFTADQFGSADWEIVDLPNGYVAAIRRQLG